MVILRRVDLGDRLGELEQLGRRGVGVGVLQHRHHAALDEARDVGLGADARVDPAQRALLVGRAVEVAAGQAVADAGEGHRVVAVEVDPALREPLLLQVGVGEPARVGDGDAADVVDHVLEEREPRDHHVVGLDADEVAHRPGHAARAGEVERGVDLLPAVAGDADPRVAGYADGGGGAGAGVDPDQLQGVAAGAGHRLARDGRRSRRRGSRPRPRPRWRRPGRGGSSPG